MKYSNYLPDELLLEILEYIEHWEPEQRQPSLARFCSVSRQWYDVGIRKLYEEPYLSGRAYELFVRTCCPSVMAHIKPSALSGLVKVLDLSHIVHNSNKATTARELYLYFWDMGGFFFGEAREREGLLLLGSASKARR
jgi:hypothetical protein